MFETFKDYARDLWRKWGPLGAISQLSKDIYYTIRLPHFFLYFLATAYGWAIATRTFPNPIIFVNLLYSLLYGSLSSFLSDGYNMEVTRLAIACMSNGLLFIAILMYNDYCDYEIDVKSKKKDTLLTRRIVNRNEQLLIVLALIIIITIMACLVSLPFLLITLFGFFGLWFYSAKPIQTKRRAGPDLLCNGFHPWLIAVSGAIVGVPSLKAIPYIHFLCVGFMGMIIFALTCFMDLEDDRERGVNTICVRLGFVGSTIFIFAVIAGLFILLGLDSYFNYVFTFRWFLLSFPIILAGIAIILFGFFRWIFIWGERRCFPDPVYYKKAYRYIEIGVPIALFPFFLFIVDCSLYDLPWF